MMHLGWFVGRGYSVHGWQQDWWGDEALDWASPDIDLAVAQALDRACFDDVMIEDGSLMPDAYEGSSRAYRADISARLAAWGRPLFTEPHSRRNIAEITDGLVPALQRRGQARRAYAHSTLPETLMEF